MNNNQDVKDDILSGAALMIAAQFFSASVVTAVKVVSADVATPTIIFIGYCICLVMVIAIATKKKLAFKTEHIKLQIIRSAFGVLYFGGMFLAVRYIPVVDAVLLRSTSPLWVPLISLIFLHDKIDKRIGLGVAIGFVGIVFVLHPTLVTINAGYFIGLSSGIFFACSGIVTRELNRFNEPLLRTLFYSFLIPSLVLAPFACMHWPLELTHLDITLLIFIGLGTLALLLLFTYALRYASAAVLMPLTYVGVIIAGFYDWFLWGIVPNLVSIVGIVTVFLSCFYIIWMKNKDLKESTHHAG